MELMTNPDISNLIHYGIEGKDYSEDAEGTVWLTENLTPLSAAYIKAAGYYTNPYLSKSLVYQAADKLKYSNEFYADLQTFYPEFIDIHTLRQKYDLDTLNGLFLWYRENGEEDSKGAIANSICTLEDGLEEHMAEFLKLKQKNGMNQLIDEINQAYFTWKDRQQKEP